MVGQNSGVSWLSGRTPTSVGGWTELRRWSAAGWKSGGGRGGVWWQESSHSSLSFLPYLLASFSSLLFFSALLAWALSHEK
ncbi:hypothetical protein IEQ34_013797 [Dendrobium chrysotoxum]|uniref:Uncharacterized protein n=1 Tax=Dendrobium chrysotoxum TaxID=161865 RepID=A0AAV7GQU3_DENCH|nr:hypothetical protein IEQ34_013797 [Dendrobium chrysotoxum]